MFKTQVTHASLSPFNLLCLNSITDSPLLAGDAKTALRQLALMLDSGAAPEQILGQLGWLVRTKFPFQAPTMLRAAVYALFRTDLDLKRSAGEPRVLLERLVVELCARGANRPLQVGGRR